MENITSIVKKLLGDIQKKTDEAPGDIQQYWENLLATKHRGHTRIVQGSKDKLVIYVDSPARLFELNSQKQKFVTLLRREFSEIRHVYFKIGKTQ